MGEIEEHGGQKPPGRRSSPSIRTTISLSQPAEPSQSRGQSARMTTLPTSQTRREDANRRKKKEDSMFSVFRNPFAAMSKKNTRDITATLGHVDGRSLRRDDSSEAARNHAGVLSPTPTDWDGLEASQLGTADVKRTTSFMQNNPRIQQSIDAFVVENQSSSVRIAARSLRRQANAKGLSQRRHKKVINKYIGMVPTAPVRDQPVGTEGQDDGVNLRFRYKLTNLRRKVINNRDGNSKIVRFNESRMAKFGWLFVWQGTVFAKPSAPFIWFQSLSLILLALVSFAVSYFCSKYVYTEASWSRFEHEDLNQIWEVLDEFKVVADTSQVLTTLVSFLLGLYVTKTVDIWWNIRHELLQVRLEDRGFRNEMD